MPESHGTYTDFLLPWTRRLQAACPSFEFEILGEGSPLGRLENQFAQVSARRVDIAHSPASLPPGRFPLTNLMNLPFLVEDAAAASQRLWAACAPHLAAEFRPLHVLALHADSGGVLHLRDRRIRAVADLAGLRLRTPAGAIAEAMRELGVEPVQILPPDLGQAAREGRIDGAVMAWDVLAYTRTETIFRHHYSDVFYVSPLYLVMHPESYAGLAEAERRTLDRLSGADLAARFGAYWQRWAAPGRALAEAEGHTLEPLPAPVLAALRAAGAQSAQRQVARLQATGVAGAPEVLEIFSGRSRRDAAAGASG